MMKARQILLVILILMVVSFAGVRIYHSKDLVAQRAEEAITANDDNLKLLGHYDSDLEPLWIYGDDEGFVVIELHRRYWGYLRRLGYQESQSGLKNKGTSILTQNQTLSDGTSRYIFVGKVDLSRVNTLKIQIGQNEITPPIDQVTGYWFLQLDPEEIEGAEEYQVETLYDDEVIDVFLYEFKDI